MGTYRLRAPASRVGYVPDAQGGLPPGPRVLCVRTDVPWSPRHKLSSKEIVALLLAAHADPMAEDADGWQALHWAASVNAEDPIRL